MEVERDNAPRIFANEFESPARYLKLSCVLQFHSEDKTSYYKISSYKVFPDLLHLFMFDLSFDYRKKKTKLYHLIKKVPLVLDILLDFPLKKSKAVFVQSPTWNYSFNYEK
ncbi:unnamed protein product [Lepeophtheirus salmonis]|uniref:(salmon louse) hypothetical protein n=1 Tax=Lepeophtheirus salmonis TaxID=72036 RepID=A0A7R8CMS5_LEPSM|nr:unnamed protein product [Lepeophtheirus salmonis]CAF2867835.1 unnamed protein product [Lepeophtheirus salmonis]